MNEITLLIENWNTTGTNSKHDPEWKSFYSKFRNRFKKELQKIGVTNIEINQGHYFVYGFFTTQNNNIYYFSVGDVRWSDGKLLYRTAKSYKDYTGGGNCFVEIGDNMINNMVLN